MAGMREGGFCWDSNVSLENVVRLIVVEWRGGLWWNYIVEYCWSIHWWCNKLMMMVKVFAIDGEIN